MKKSRVLCSTGAIIGRNNAFDYKLIMEYAPKIHCDGFEFMMFHHFAEGNNWYENIEQVGKDLSKSGLSFPVFHIDKRIGEFISRNEGDDIENAIYFFEENCKLANAIDSKKLVLHLWGGIYSDKHIDINIKCFDRLIQIAQKSNLLLTVENVVCNQLEPMTHLYELIEKYQKVVFTYDTKMAAFHQQLEELYLEKNKKLWNEYRICHMHINDYAGGYMDWANLKALHIGDGHIDFEQFFNFIRKVKYDGDFTMEANSINKDGSVNIDKLNSSLDFIYQHCN